MSCCLILQSRNNVCIGADTAISIESGNQFIRHGNDGEKIFEVGKDIVFCSGDMSEVPKVLKNMKTQNGYVDLVHLSNYLKNKKFIKKPNFDFPSIAVIVCRVVDGVSYMYDFSECNNFDIVTHTISQDGVQVWVGGIYNEKCLEIALDEFKRFHGEVINTYINTYKKMACQEIGGKINVYYLDSNGHQKIINDYDLNDGYRPISLFDGLVHGIIADAIVGKLIASENVYIGNKNNSVQITGNGINITNGSIQLTNGTNTICIDPDNEEKLFSIKNGKTDCLYTDNEGNLNLTGKITGGEININNNFIVDKEGNITSKGNMSLGNGGLTYDTENGLEINGNVTSNATISGGTIEGADLLGGSINIGENTFVVGTDGYVEINTGNNTGSDEYPITINENNGCSTQIGNMSILMNKSNESVKIQPDSICLKENNNMQIEIFTDKIVSGYCGAEGRLVPGFSITPDDIICEGNEDYSFSGVYETMNTKVSNAGRVSSIEYIDIRGESYLRVLVDGNTWVYFKPDTPPLILDPLST